MAEALGWQAVVWRSRLEPTGCARDRGTLRGVRRDRFLSVLPACPARDECVARGRRHPTCVWLSRVREHSHHRQIQALARRSRYPVGTTAAPSYMAKHNRGVRLFLRGGDTGHSDNVLAGFRRLESQKRTFEMVRPHWAEVTTA